MNRETRNFVKKVWKVLTFYVLIILISSAIFSRIEGWSFFEALYQIVITVSTVGFGEIKEVSDLGRAYLMGVIVFQTGFFVYVASQITYLMAEGKLLEIIRYRRLMKMLEGKKGHTIVVGLGRTGMAIAETLKKFGEDIVAIEADPEKARVFREMYPRVPVIEGDAKEESTLNLARVKEAKRLLVNTSSDSENMFIVVTARGLNPELFISTRVIKPRNEEKLLKAGANQTFNPETMSGRSIAISVLKPDVSSFLAEVLTSEESPYMFESVEIHTSSPFIGRKIKDFFNEDIFGNLLAIVRGKDLIVNPPKETVVKEGDRLLVLGSLEQIENLMSTLGH